MFKCENEIHKQYVVGKFHLYLPDNANFSWVFKFSAYPRTKSSTVRCYNQKKTILLSTLQEIFKAFQYIYNTFDNISITNYLLIVFKELNNFQIIHIYILILILNVNISEIA